MPATKQKIVIFGTGQGGRNGFRHLQKKGVIVAFADNNTSKQGQCFMGVPVISPNEIHTLVFDRIVICSMYHNDILAQLTQQHNIPPEKIAVLDPAIRQYGPRNPIGCLLVSICLIAGMMFAAMKIFSWIRH